MAKKSKKGKDSNPVQEQKKGRLTKLKKAIRKLKLFELKLKSKEKKIDKELKKLKLDGLKESKSKKDKKKQKADKSKKKPKEVKNKTDVKKKLIKSKTNTAVASTTSAEKSVPTVGKKPPKSTNRRVPVRRNASKVTITKPVAKAKSTSSNDVNVSNALAHIRKMITIEDLQNFVKGDVRLTVKKAAAAKLKSLTRKD